LLAGVASCAAACASSTRNPVLDSYPAGVEGHTSVTYYDVHGRTYAELHAEMRRLGPRSFGSSFVGETRSPMEWTWRVESRASSSCTLRDVRVKVNAEILLPRWTPPADADSSVVAEWNRFISALEKHEAGHKDISARAGRTLKDQLRGLNGFCSQVNTQANDIARRVIETASLEQRRYDADTQHGLTQGTGFGRGSTAMRVTGATSDSASELVTRLIVTPASLELNVGDKVTGIDLFQRLDVQGTTARGDTLRHFARRYEIEPSELLVRTGIAFVARGAGDVSLWVSIESQPPGAMRESPRTVRVPIHIR
jgi:predicted secreted Zn-dependent protease